MWEIQAWVRQEKSVFSHVEPALHGFPQNHFFPLQGSWGSLTSTSHNHLAAHQPNSCPSLQFNARQHCWAMVPSLSWAWSTWRGTEGGSAFKNGGPGGKTDTSWPPFRPGHINGDSFLPFLKCEGSQREPLSLGPADKQRAPVCVCLGGRPSRWPCTLWPSLLYCFLCLLFPHLESSIWALLIFRSLPILPTPVSWKKEGREGWKEREVERKEGQKEGRKGGREGKKKKEGTKKEKKGRERKKNGKERDGKERKKEGKERILGERQL